MNKSGISDFIFYLTLLFLPTQLGRHFWPEFSYVYGARVDYLSPTIYLTDILIGVLFIAWLFPYFAIQNSKFKIQNYRSKFKNNSLLIFLFLFLIIGIVFSKNQLAGWYGLLKFLEFLFFGYYIATTITLKKLRIITAIFSIGVFYESIIAIFQYINQSSAGGLLYLLGERNFNAQTPGIANTRINGELILRPYGTLPHPNVLAAYFLISLTLIFNFQFSIFNKISIFNLKKFFFITTVIIGSVGLFLTMSRVAIFLWFLILGYYFVFYLKKTFNNKNAIGLLGVLFIGSIGIYFLSPLSSRFFDLNLTDESFVQRKELVQASFLMIKANPFFGVGLNNFLPNLSDFYDFHASSFFTYLQPVHNIYLLIAAQTGIIGFSFFVWFLWKTILGIKNKELGIRGNFAIIHNSKFLILVTVLVLGLFDHYFLTLQQGQLLFSFILGLCFSNIDGIIKKRIK